MANLKEIRQRMSSVRSTRQVTSAMKMVSAAKLRKAQDTVLRIRPYAKKIGELIANLMNATAQEEINSPLTKSNAAAPVLVVAINSNRGLCGGFNANIHKRSMQVIDELKAQGKEVRVLAIGKKAYDFLRVRVANVEENNNLYSSLDFDHVNAVADSIITRFVAGDFSKVILVYNKFKSTASQEVTTEDFLPIASIECDQKASNDNYIFEPSQEEIIGQLLPLSRKIQFYQALLNSFAAEHGSRMTAMHKATDNATELLRTLNLQYNKARQAAITNEITEIVGGANALKS